MLITAETTADEIEEALGHLVTAARTATERGNDLLYNVMHSRIDSHLRVWQALTADDPTDIRPALSDH